MGFFDFLVSEPGSKKGIYGKDGPVPALNDDGPDARSWLERFWGVTYPRGYVCGTCGWGGDGHRCRCDPKLGRPRRWWE